MNGVSLYARAQMQKTAVDYYKYHGGETPPSWGNNRYWRLSSTVCDSNFVGFTELSGDGYTEIWKPKEWFTGWTGGDITSPTYDTGGYLNLTPTGDVVFPLNSGSSNWADILQIAVLTAAASSGATFIFGAEPDAPIVIEPAQRLVLLSGDNPTSSPSTAGLVAFNTVP